MRKRFDIKLENNDGKIWHRDKVILQLVQAMIHDQDINLRLNQEGPCAESLGVYDLLDLVCQNMQYDPNRICITTCNQIQSQNKYQIQRIPPSRWLHDLQQLSRSNPGLCEKNIQHTKYHFGHFVGHSSRFRLVIAAWLWKHHRACTLQTFHSTPLSELHREFLSLEDVWFHNYGIEHVKNAVEFLEHVPFSYDHHSDRPILDEKMYTILGAYPNIFVDLVCATYVTGQTFYVDEKIWRPIVTKTPFMPHGPANYIKNLRRLGFETFDRWWDEGYSEDPPDVQVHQILANVDMIAQWDKEKIQNTYHEMQAVLDHNYDRFLNLTLQDFQDVFGY